MQAMQAEEEDSEKYTRPRLSHTCTYDYDCDINDDVSTTKATNQDLTQGSQATRAKETLPVRNHGNHGNYEDITTTQAMTLVNMFM